MTLNKSEHNYYKLKTYAIIILTLIEADLNLLIVMRITITFKYKNNNTS